MRMVRRDERTVALGLGLVLSLLGAAGCGGSDKSSSRPDTASGESTGKNTAQATPADSSVGTTGGAATRRRVRVVLLGTSLTAGLGLDPEKAYPALLQAKVDSAGFPITIVNAGLSGETSAG